MRWFPAAYPSAEISACDLRSNDMAFCEQYFGARTWVTGTDIALLNSTERYDLIWLGSVITHLSAENSTKLLEKMISWTNPGGIVVASLHGRHALHLQDSGQYRYIHDDAWRMIKSDFHKVGYGYADYEGQSGYGISVVKLSWIAAAVESRTDVRLVMLTERAWAGHHDIVALQRT